MYITTSCEMDTPAEQEASQARKIEGKRQVFSLTPAAKLFSGPRSAKTRSAGVFRAYPSGDESGNTGLVTVLAGQMPADYQTIVSAIISLANNPSTVLTFARTTRATDLPAEMYGGGACQWARQDAKMHG